MRRLSDESNQTITLVLVLLGFEIGRVALLVSKWFGFGLTTLN